MGDKAVITCALNGVLTDPKQHNVPVTPEQMAREAAMMDELLATELAEAACYVIWLEECLSYGVEDVIGAHHLQPVSVIRAVASLA